MEAAKNLPTAPGLSQAPPRSAWVKRSRGRPVWGLFHAVVPATPASRWGIQQVAPATRRAFQSCTKLRDNGPNCGLKIAKLGRGPAFKRLVLVAWLWRACHYSAIFLIQPFFAPVDSFSL